MLKLSGEVDLAVVGDLLDAFQKCAGARYVVLDTSEVSFLDLTGLETIIQGSQIVGEGRFRLVPGKATERLLDLTETLDHFRLEAADSDDTDPRDRPQNTGLAGKRCLEYHLIIRPCAGGRPESGDLSAARARLGACDRLDRPGHGAIG